MLKHSVMLKFNNVETLKSLLKLLKRTANRAGQVAAAKPDGARQYLKMCACGRESKGAPILGKLFLKNFKKSLTKCEKNGEI